MNLKKSLLVLSAVFMSSFSFAGNAFYMQSTFVKPAPEFTAEERQGATAYAYTRFFEDFSQRLAEGNYTEADAQIIQAVETHMLPALHAFVEASAVTEENQPTEESLEESDRQVRQAGKEVLPLLTNEFDFKEINQILSQNRADKNEPQNWFPPVFSAKHLDGAVMNICVLDLSVAYLSAAEELSAEETIMLELVISEKIKKLK